VATPPDTYPSAVQDHGSNVGAVATGVAGLVGGALLGAAAVTARGLSREHAAEAAQPRPDTKEG
jgi:hypothetical protein